jgi:LPXTG-motif cell wall-anchored protein
LLTASASSSQAHQNAMWGDQLKDMGIGDKFLGLFDKATGINVFLPEAQNKINELLSGLKLPTIAVDATGSISPKTIMMIAGAGVGFWFFFIRKKRK